VVRVTAEYGVGEFTFRRMVALWNKPFIESGSLQEQGLMGTVEISEPGAVLGSSSKVG
jgi:hypothetical protein